MRLLRRFRRSRRRQSLAKTVAPSGSQRWEPLLPTRENRQWWVAGLMVVAVLTWIGRPADFSRRVLDQRATERAREIARKSTLPIYRYDPSSEQNLDRVLRDIEAVRRLGSLSPAQQQSYLIRMPLVRQHLSERQIRLLLRLNEAEFLEVRHRATRLLKQIASRGVVVSGKGVGTLWNELAAYFDPKYTTQWTNVESMAIRIMPDNRVVAVSDLLTLEEALTEIQRAARTEPLATAALPEVVTQMRTLIYEVTSAFLRPNLTFDAIATRQEQERRAAQVEPVYRTRYDRPAVVYLGTFTLLGLTLLIASIFLVPQPAVRTRNWRPLAATGALLLLSIVGLYVGVRGVLFVEGIEFPVLVIPVALSAALATILLGSPFGLFATGFLVLMAGLMAGAANPLGFSQFLTLATAGLFASATVSRAHHRRDLVVVGFYMTLVTTTVAMGSLLLIGGVDSGTLGRVAGWTVVAGATTTVVLPGVQPVFEYLAGTASDLELIELADLNHPLLVQLEKVAPGTYNHSLNVARLAEAAAEAIGASALLVRVGAYFHDIGKMNYPEYFIENQEGGANPHDQLKPTMSARILVAHVKNGVDLAREHQLPRAVIDLIQQHHGTSLIRPFYHKAIQAGEQVDESSFRYPGPKPQSREAAVLMLADSIEPAARARFQGLAVLTHRDCAQLVSDVVNHYFFDGQLDESDLTLNDLRLVSESFRRTLIGMYHSRIEYPEDKEKKGSLTGTGKGRPVPEQEEAGAEPHA